MSARKRTATSFFELVIAGNIHEAYQKYVSPDMRHHNAYYKGDAASLKKGMEENHQQFPNKILEVKHILEEGDLVAVHSHVRLQPEKPGIAVVHLLRFDGDKIAEMWDVGQEIPENMPNENGMF
jgi:predicted SnoaL-like aldol condensation-catalyzing enzyme